MEKLEHFSQSLLLSKIPNALFPQKLQFLCSELTHSRKLLPTRLTDVIGTTLIPQLLIFQLHVCHKYGN